MSGNNGGWDSPPMPRDPKHHRLPRDPGSRPQTPWLNSFSSDQRRYMHWYLDQQIVLVQKLFYQRFRDWRLKLQLQIVMMRLQDILAHPNDPANGQPQQFLDSYSLSEKRLLSQYAQQEAKDFGDQMYERFEVRRSVDDINKALLELRMWLINEHAPAPEEPPKSSSSAPRMNIEDLNLMLADLNIAPPRRQEALRSAAADPMEHAALLKRCFQIKHAEQAVDGEEAAHALAVRMSANDSAPARSASAPSPKPTVATSSRPTAATSPRPTAVTSARLTAATSAGPTAAFTARPSLVTAAPVRSANAASMSRSAIGSAISRPGAPVGRVSAAPAVRSIDSDSDADSERERAQAQQGQPRALYQWSAALAQYDASIRQWSAASHVDPATRRAQLERLYQARRAILAKQASTAPPSLSAIKQLSAGANDAADSDEDEDEDEDNEEDDSDEESDEE